MWWKNMWFIFQLTLSSSEPERPYTWPQGGMRVITPRSYIFLDFSASIYSYLVSFLYNCNFFWGNIPPLKFCTQLRTLHFYTFFVNKFFCLVLYAKLTLFYYRMQHIFFPDFRVEIMPVWIKNYCEVLTPKNLFDQVNKITLSISYCEDIVQVGLIVKDSVIICETIKWVFGTTLFRGDF